MHQPSGGGERPQPARVDTPGPKVCPNVKYRLNKNNAPAVFPNKAHRCPEIAVPRALATKIKEFRLPRSTLIILAML